MTTNVTHGDTGASVDAALAEIIEGSPLEETISGIATDDRKRRLYESQESTVTLEPGAPAAAAAKPKKTKGSKKKAVETAGAAEPTTEAPKAKRVRLNVNDLPEAAYVLDVGGTSDKTGVLGARPTAKKIAEKFDNLLVSVASEKLPSGYTVAAFKALDAAGSMTGPEMVKAIQDGMPGDKSEHASLGTARSQAQQMMNLFQAVRIANKDGNKIVLNGNSTYAAVLRALIERAGVPPAA